MPLAGPNIVVYATSTGEVAQVLRLADVYGVPVTPYGAGSWRCSLSPVAHCREGGQATARHRISATGSHGSLKPLDLTVP